MRAVHLRLHVENIAKLAVSNALKQLLYLDVVAVHIARVKYLATALYGVDHFGKGDGIGAAGLFHMQVLSAFGDHFCVFGKVDLLGLHGDRVDFGVGEDLLHRQLGIAVKDAEDIGDDLVLVLGECITNDLVDVGELLQGFENIVYEFLSQAAPSVFKFKIDITIEPLQRSLHCNPFLIKPNIDELSEFFSTNIESSEDIIKYAKMLQNMGAQNVLVSLGEKGAVLLTSDGKEFYCDTPAGNFQNSVGAGDSMVAGFIYEYIKTQNMGKALKFSVAAGSATAYSPWLAEKENILKLYEIM